MYVMGRHQVHTGYIPNICTTDILTGYVPVLMSSYLIKMYQLSTKYVPCMNPTRFILSCNMYLYQRKGARKQYIIKIKT